MAVPARSLLAAVFAATVALGAAQSVAATAAPAPQTRASAQATATKVDWPQYHGTPDHQGLNRQERKIGADNVSQLGLSWIGDGATSVDDLVSGSSPTVVDGFVYFGTVAGQLLVFPTHCIETCEPAWRLQLGESILNTPAVVDGILYVGTSSENGRLWAFDVAECAKDQGSCSPLWTAPMSILQSSPTVSDGVVYVGSFDDNVYAFDAKGCGKAVCKPLWIGHTDGQVLNSPAVSDGVVYAGDSTGFLYAFDAAGCSRSLRGNGKVPTCKALWRGEAAASIYDASPVVHGGLVYTASFDAEPNSFLEVFDAHGCGDAVCQPVWRGTGGAYLNSAPAVAYGRVYIGDGHGTMLVFPATCKKDTCPPLWQGFGSGPVAAIQSPPMVANGVVYIGMEGRVRAFDARGCGDTLCDPLWEFLTQDPIVDSSPVMVNHTLYFSGTNFGSVPELYVFHTFRG